MIKITYYNVPADKIGLALCYLNSYGWEFNLCGNGVPIERYYIQATSRDWDGHQCIFRMEERTNCKLISTTSNLLMEANNQTDEVLSFEKFKHKYFI